MKSEFKHTINLSKYHSKVSTHEQNQYLNYWINPRFQGVNRLLALLFENNTVKEGYIA